MGVLKKKLDIPYYIIVFLLTLWGLAIFYPFYNAVLVSLVSQHIYARTPFLIYPVEFDLSSYKFVFQWRTLWSGVRVTAMITILGTAYNVLLTTLTAYTLSKPIPGRKLFNSMIVFTMYFGGGLVAFYIMMVNVLHLRNSLASMILPTGINIMYMMVMRTFFYTVPEEIEESAKLDGAGVLVILFKIVLPLSLPMLATITLFYAVDRWNEWWLGRLFIRNTGKMPLQLIIREMLRSVDMITSGIPSNVRENIDIFQDGMRMAAVVITMLPIVCLYPFMQKYFAKGLTLGGVKG